VGTVFGEIGEQTARPSAAPEKFRHLDMNGPVAVPVLRGFA